MVELEGTSPLAVIRRQEQHLAQQLQGARHAAAALIAQAQQRAAAIRDAAEHDGRREAEAYYQGEIAGAREAAARLKASGEAEACQLLQNGRRQLSRAVQAIIAFVSPT